MGMCQKQLLTSLVMHHCHFHPLPPVESICAPSLLATVTSVRAPFWCHGSTSQAHSDACGLVPNGACRLRWTRMDPWVISAASQERVQAEQESSRSSPETLSSSHQLGLPLRTQVFCQTYSMFRCPFRRGPKSILKLMKLKHSLTLMVCLWHFYITSMCS